MDAAECKQVAFGLLFLKYASRSYESRRARLSWGLERDGITGPHLERRPNSRDDYTAERIFWAPPEALWQNLRNQGASPDIATLIDDTILAVEGDDPNLNNKLPRDDARRRIEPVKMKGLTDLIAASIGLPGGTPKQARDMLGQVYEPVVMTLPMSQSAATYRTLPSP